jgi:hypothetical protein
MERWAIDFYFFDIVSVCIEYYWRRITGVITQLQIRTVIFNIAIADVLLTILGAYIIYIFLPKYNFFVILISFFILGIVLHRVFCVKTTIDKLLFE